MQKYNTGKRRRYYSIFRGWTDEGFGLIFLRRLWDYLSEKYKHARGKIPTDPMTEERLKKS